MLHSLNLIVVCNWYNRLSIDNVSVKEATIDNLPRVDYTDGTSSLLVEPQRTNLITYSEDFSQWSLKIRYDVTLQFRNSPDGLLMLPLCDNNSNAQHFIVSIFLLLMVKIFQLASMLRKTNMMTYTDKS